MLAARSSLDRVKNAVYWTPGLTLTTFAEEALLAHLAKLEKKNGGTFDRRKGALKVGRPMR